MNKTISLMKRIQTPKLRKAVVLTLLLLTAWVVGSTAQDEPTDEELLQAMDFARFGAFFTIAQSEAQGGIVTMEIVAQRPEGGSEATIQILWKLFDENDFRFRVEYITPEELAGDVFLVTPEEVFFWNPDLLSPIKVNGQFEVFGDATVAEVVGIFFNGSYTIENRESVTLEDGRPGIQLDLSAVAEFVAFQKAQVTADFETLQPVNLKLFDESGDLLHDNTFESYTAFDNGPLFEKQLLDNRIVPVNQTLLDLSDFIAFAHEDDVFNPAALGN